MVFLVQPLPVTKPVFKLWHSNFVFSFTYMEFVASALMLISRICPTGVYSWAPLAGVGGRNLGRYSPSVQDGTAGSTKILQKRNNVQPVFIGWKWKLIHQMVQSRISIQLLLLKIVPNIFGNRLNTATPTKTNTHTCFCSVQQLSSFLISEQLFVVINSSSQETKSYPL